MKIQRQDKNFHANMTSKLLAVFDFDHTLVDGNTDTWITKLCEDVKLVLDNEGICWTDRMAGVFQALHDRKFTKLDFEQCLQSLPFTKGMKELLHFIANEKIECIIISDSNSFFINYLLEFSNISCVKEVYTNPASWTDNQLLTIQHYHSHNCGHCRVNMCKGDILKSYIRNTNSVVDKTVVYVGDGRNDYCAALQMKPSDYVFAREGYSLLKLLRQNDQDVQPFVIPWATGFDILEKIKNIIAKQ